MSTRIQGSAAQSIPTPETTDAEVEQSRTAAASSTSAAKATAQADAKERDSIENAGTREAPEEAPGGHAPDAGRSVSARELQLTDGKSGHAALKEGTPSGNNLRDGNWVSHSRTLRTASRSATVEREGLQPRMKAAPALHSKEEKATSHRRPGGLKREANATLWKAEAPTFDKALVAPLVKGKNGSISLLRAQAQAGVKIQAGGGAFKGEAGAGVEANLVNAEVHAEHKGTMNLKGAAHLSVGGKAEAKLTAEFDPKNLTAAVKGGVDAFVGVTAGVTGSAEIAGVGAGGEAKVQAGLGFEANGTAELKNGKLELKGDLGACVGVGADVKFNFEIDARKIAQEANEAGKYLEKKEQELAGAVEQAALEGMASAASHAFSFLQEASAVAHAVESGAEALADAAGRP